VKLLSIGGTEGNGGARAWAHAEAQEQRSPPASLGLRAASYRSSGRCGGPEPAPHAGGTAAHVLYPLRLPTPAARPRTSSTALPSRLRRLGLILIDPKVLRSILEREPRYTTIWTLGSACLRAGVFRCCAYARAQNKSKMGYYVFIGLSHEKPFEPLRPGLLKTLHLF
jgi:hypothetical protein